MNNTKQSKSNASRVRSLGLLEKTLPLTAATPPQLRHRRQFQFNGMHFETNPGTTHGCRDHPYHAYKSSPSSAVSRVPPLHGSVSPGNEKDIFRVAPQPIVTQPHPQPLQQPDERTAWRGEGHGNNQAGGEDAYNNSNSNSYNMNSYNDNMNTQLYNNMSNQIHNCNINNQPDNNHNNITTNRHPQSNFNNNSNNNRFYHVLTKYSRQPIGEDYKMNNNNSNNVDSHNNSNCNSYKSSYENEKRIEDIQSTDHYTKEELQFSTRIYNRPLEFTGGGGSSSFNATAAVNPSKMDYITLTGSLRGYLTSNMLTFLCWYFS